MEKKVIVTGGAGFIGSHTVVELMDCGYTPIIIDNFSNSEEFILERLEKLIGKKVKCYKVDCRDKEALDKIFQEEKPDSVIHFAAFKAVGESVEEPLKYYNNNLGSLIILLEVMKKNQVNTLVFSSSCTVYGEPESVPVSESTPMKKAASPYGNTKIICEQILKEFMVENKEFKISCLRYFNPIGAHPSSLIGELPRGIPNNLVPYITQTAAGWRQELTINGNDYDTVDGTCIRDYIHVVDLARAHVATLSWLENKEGLSTTEIFNLGTGKGHTVLEAVNTFMEVTGQPVKYKIGPRRAGDVVKIFASVEKANKELNWKTNYTLADALKHAWQWQLTLEK